MDSKYQKYAKRVGYKKKGSIWIDSLGFPVSESEIRDSFHELEKIMETNNGSV